MDYARNPSALAARNRSPIRFPNPARNVLAIRPGSRTIGATMQPALSTPFTHPYVPAMGLRSEKPHQGVRRKNPAPYRGRNRCKFRTVLGLRAGCAGNRVRSRCSGEQFDPDLGLYYLRARYYNPLSGRFLSVDSQTGQGQRRYEYANADPVNSLDPSGNEAIIEWALLTFYPGPIPIRFPGFPSWCGFEMDGYLPGCGGGGGGGQSGTGAGPGAPGGPPAPPPCTGRHCRPCPECFAQLKYRSVFVPNHGRYRKDTGRNHSFWYVLGQDGAAEVIDAGPADEDCSPWHACGLLVDWPPFNPNHGHYPEDFPGAATEWSAPQSDQLADQVAALESAANNWNSQHRNTWYKLGGTWNPNSNTFAHDLGNDAGFNNVSPPMTAPPDAPGW